jgi:hypothetical protein
MKRPRRACAAEPQPIAAFSAALRETRKKVWRADTQRTQRKPSVETPFFLTRVGRYWQLVHVCERCDGELSTFWRQIEVGIKPATFF